MTARVLVTGAGGPAGVAVLQELDRLAIPVVAADGDPDAVGFGLTALSTVVPRAADPAFLDSLLSVASATGADAVISTVAEELAVLAASAPLLAAAGVAAWLPTPDALARCTDKWAFAKSLEEGRVPAPVTGLGTAADVPGPWLVKPRYGRGSRHVLTTSDPRDLPTLLRLVPEPIVQTLVQGREFTADCLVDDDGEVLGVVPRWRTETRGGISTRGTTFLDDRVDELVAGVVRATGVTTSITVQGFLRPRGPAIAVEVNPRFSGGLPLSLAAGADLVGQHVRRLRGLPVDRARLVARPGVTFHRYFAHHVTEDPA